MVLAFALELLSLFFPQERNGFPFFIHRCSPDQPPLASGVPKQIILGAYSFVMSATCSSNVCQKIISLTSYPIL